jgi:aminoglycoside phosphotransferase (APT) family kinase protein
VATRSPHPNRQVMGASRAQLRRNPVTAGHRAWVERHTGARVTRVRRLVGASSTAVHGLTLADGRRVALRRYAWTAFMEAEPDAPQREVDSLRFARAHALPVPDVLAADVTGHEIGDGVPALLMSFVPGRPVAVPDVEALAEVAAAIHAIDADGFAHEYFPWYADTTVAPPPDSVQPSLWTRAIELWHTAVPPYEPRFIHRDFHPGNVLWSRGRATGVVDWPNGCRGPRGCDVAHCRDNLLTLAGERAADEFTAAYEAVTGEAHHPFWELASVLEHGPSWWTGPRLAESEPRLARAVADLGG